MISKLFLVTLATCLNVYFWNKYGSSVRLAELQKANPELYPTALSEGEILAKTLAAQEEKCKGIREQEAADQSYEFPSQRMPTIHSEDANDFDQFRQKYLGFFRLGNEKTLYVNFDGRRCDRYLNAYAVRGDRKTTDKTPAAQQCVAAVRLASQGTNGTSHHLLRFDVSSKFDEADDAFAKENAKKPPPKNLILKSDDIQSNEVTEMRVPTGFFTKVSRKRNREKVNRKMAPFFNHFESMDKFVGKCRALCTQCTLMCSVLYSHQFEFDLPLICCPLQAISSPTTDSRPVMMRY